MKPHIALRTHRRYNNRPSFQQTTNRSQEATKAYGSAGWKKSKISYFVRGHQQKQFRLMSNSLRNPRADCHLDRATDRADTAMPELPEDAAIILQGFGVGVTRPRDRGTSWMSASSRKSASLLLSARSYSLPLHCRTPVPSFCKRWWGCGAPALLWRCLDPSGRLSLSSAEHRAKLSNMPKGNPRLTCRL